MNNRKNFHFLRDRYNKLWNNKLVKTPEINYSCPGRRWTCVRAAFIHPQLQIAPTGGEGMDIKGNCFREFTLTVGSLSSGMWLWNGKHLLSCCNGKWKTNSYLGENICERQLQKKVRFSQLGIALVWLGQQGLGQIRNLCLRINFHLSAAFPPSVGSLKRDFLEGSFALVMPQWLQKRTWKKRRIISKCPCIHSSTSVEGLSSEIFILWRKSKQGDF